MGSVGELELIQRSLEGDLEAWGEIVVRYKRMVFGAALAVLRNWADAEDATQEAFIRAYEKLHYYDLSRKFSTWLLTVTVNVAKNMLRKRRRPDPEPETFHTDDPATAVEREELRRAVKEAVWSLPEDYRLPLVLYYWEGLSVEEIAKVMRLKPATVKTRLFRGRALVKGKLLEMGVTVDAI
ncbi:RNA polymerase sigma factor [Candidatus Bipolaricaulota sp. J31]